MGFLSLTFSEMAIQPEDTEVSTGVWAGEGEMGGDIIGW